MLYEMYPTVQEGMSGLSLSSDVITISMVMVYTALETVSHPKGIVSIAVHCYRIYYIHVYLEAYIEIVLNLFIK